MSVDNRSHAGLIRQGVSIALAGALALNGGVVWGASGKTGSATPAAALVVESDPAGANVYVDGQFTGQTPLSVSTLANGDHRVRLVKDGYLENGRIVTVNSKNSQNVQVKLTPRSGANAEATAQVSSGGGGGSSKKKWIIIGAAGGAGAGTAVYLATRNKAPVGGAVTVTPTATGMAGVTTYTFTSNASDPDGDSLTYAWDFGDGGTATVASPTHIFSPATTTTTSFTVKLSVSDGKKSADATTASVTVGRAFAGTWTGGVEPGFNDPFSITVTQAGTSVSGSTSFGGTSITGLTGTLGGTTYPTAVTYTQRYNLTGVGTVSDVFTGNTDSTGSSMTGTMVVTLPAGFVFVSTGTATASGSITLRR